MMIDYKDELNEEQYTCVTSGNGTAYVLAGAGSGKTRVLTYRTAWLIENGTPPNRIMLLTFTNKAAKEMLDRVEALTGLNLITLWGGTFHHVGNLMLRRTGRFYGYSSDYMIIDEVDAASLIEECRKELQIKDKVFPKTKVIKNILSSAINSLQDVPVTISTKFPHLLEYTKDLIKLQKKYTNRKIQQNLMDFDDLLYYWWKILENGEPPYKFEHILVDEYQDTNHLQAKIVDKMANQVSNLMVVGDDAQSIYSFRGADYRNIRDFTLRYSDAKIYKLQTNYRSTPQILHLANKIIEGGDARFKKTLIPFVRDGEIPVVVAANDTFLQSRFVIYKIQELLSRGISYSDIGILYRAHYQSAELEIQLARSDIPYIVRSGAKFFERAHIKDTLSYLRVIANPRDWISFRRLLKIEEGIGDVIAHRIFQDINTSNDPLKRFLTHHTEAPSKAIHGVEHAKKILGGIGKLTPTEAIKFILESGYNKYLELSYPDALERKDDLKLLVDLADNYSSLPRFLSEITLSEPVTGDDSYLIQSSDDRIILSTIHRAKGLEWDIVFLIYACDGGLPITRSYESIEQYEEERRLFYVAVTRARKELYITYPMRSPRGRVYLVASPFLRELDEEAYRIMWV